MLVTREFRLQLFLAICQNLKILWYFEIFVNTEPYGTGNFKTLLLVQFHSIRAKLYDKCGSHRGIQSYGYFGDLPKIINFVAL